MALELLDDDDEKDEEAEVVEDEFAGLMNFSVLFIAPFDDDERDNDGEEVPEGKSAPVLRGKMPAC